jgi:iron complex outermembrane recepter protein
VKNEQQARIRARSTGGAGKVPAAALTATASAVLLLMAASAQAQDASPPVQTITVTGIRGAIESAISVKKNSNEIVESLSAEDIGKLPDSTIAESLARLPGVTTQRDAQGNATNINIRGLGPNFNGYLLNGREQTSTGDDRAVDLSVYPSELIGGAEVYKTSNASLMAAGLAGTLDTRLVNPLDYSHRVLAGTVSSTKNGVGLPVTGKGKRYSLSYIDQFADRKLGIALGFVHSDSNSNSLVNGSWGGTGTATLAGGGTQTVSVPFGGGLGFETDHITDKRDGGAAIIRFKPNKRFTSEFDAYYARIKTGTKKLAAKAGNFTSLTNAVVDANGVVTSGTFDMPAGGFIAYHENLFDDDTIQSYGWKNQLEFSDTWKGSLDLSHNSAKRVERDIEAYGHTQTADTLSFTNGGATVPSLSFGNPTLYTDPATIQIHDTSGWSGVTYPAGTVVNGVDYSGKTVPQAGYSKGPTVTDKIDAIRFDFSHQLGEGAISDIQFGQNYTKRTKDRITDEGLVVSANNAGYDYIPYPAGSYVDNNVGGTGLNLLTFDPQAGLWPGAVILPKYNNDILSKTWSVKEQVYTTYAKANIDTQVKNIPVRGNVGVQLVHTAQDGVGFRADASSNVTLTNPAGGLSTDGTSYTDVLPSLNLAADLGRGNVLRLGAGVQIARPSMTDMRNSLSAAVDTNASDPTFGMITGSAGNPHLKPFKAKSLDLSYEKYFGTRAYFSAAAFYKKLDTYIVNAINPAFDFTTVASNIGLTIPAAGAIGVMTQPVNGSGGNLRGIELTASLPLSLFVHGPLGGFGVATSYASTLSSVRLPNLIGQNPTQGPAAGPDMTLPGLSHINAKLMLYYERGGFSAYVADNYRSEYVGYVNSATVGAYPAPINIGSQSWVSAQIGYEIQTGRLKGLSIRFEGNNLNKPVYREFKADGSPNTSNQTGASYIFMLGYKYE